MVLDDRTFFYQDKASDVLKYPIVEVYIRQYLSKPTFTNKGIREMGRQAARQTIRNIINVRKSSNSSDLLGLNSVCRRFVSFPKSILRNRSFNGTSRFSHSKREKVAYEGIFSRGKSRK